MFGERLKKAREERGLSQSKLAEIMGTSKAIIGRWETKPIAPKQENIIKLAAALGIAPSKLTTEVDQRLTVQELEKLISKIAALPKRKQRLISYIVDEFTRDEKVALNDH